MYLLNIDRISDSVIECAAFLVKKVPDLCEKAEELIEKEADKKADAKPKISIQQRMRDQVETLMGEWEGYLDQLVERNFDLKKWEPYKEMQAFGGGVIKPNHAKIIKDDAELLINKKCMEQIREVRALKWFTYSEVLSHIKTHNIERIKIFKKAHSIISSLL